MISNIQYTGKVTIKVKGKPPIKTKNAGTLGFFNMLSKLLAQQLVPSAHGVQKFSESMPSYIMVLKSTDADLTPESYEYEMNNTQNLLLSEVPITNYEFDDYQVSFRGVLNNSNIKSDTTVNYNGDCHVLLLDGARKNILAYTTVNLQYLKEVKDNKFSQATITWTMTFTNSEED